MSTRTKLVRRLGALAASFAGALILLEMFVMISPFILYYYGVYGPVISLLHRSRWTAWLTAFFLPHLVSFPPMPDFVTVGFLIFVVGVLAFLVNAAQLYYVKLRKKSLAVRGLYARIRHPQYLCLGVASFGLLIAWPRFIILIFFVSMLFAYYFLARDEERRMEAAFGDWYRSYRDRTSMFLGLLSQKPWPSRSIALCLWPTALILSVGVALLLRSASVQVIPKLFFADGSIAAVPLSAREASGAAAFLAEALTNRQVRARLGQGGFLALVAENDAKLHHVLIDLGMESRETKKYSGPGISAVVSRAVSPTRTVLSGEELLAVGIALEPTFMLTTAAGGGTRIVDLTPDQFRGNRAAPLF